MHALKLHSTASRLSRQVLLPLEQPCSPPP